MSDILFEAFFFFCDFIFLIEGYLAIDFVVSVNKNQSQVYPRPLPPKPPSAPSPHPFWIVHCGMMPADVLWRWSAVCSRPHFSLSLAFWLWARCHKTFLEAADSETHLCVELSGDSVPLRRDRSWAEEKANAFNCLESFSWSWELWSWDRVRLVLKWVWGLSLCVSRSFSHWIRVPWRRVWLWVSYSLHPRANPTEGISWYFWAMSTPRAWGVHHRQGGGAASPGWCSAKLLTPVSPLPLCPQAAI